MKERSISQRKLAKLSNVPLSSINALLNNDQRSYSLENVCAVADVLEVSLDRLIRDSHEHSTTVDSIPTTVVLDGAFRIRLEKLDIPITKGKK